MMLSMMLSIEDAPLTLLELAKAIIQTGCFYHVKYEYKYTSLAKWLNVRLRTKCL